MLKKSRSKYRCSSRNKMNDIILSKDNPNKDTDIILNAAEAMGSLEKELPKSQNMCSIPPRKGRSVQTHKHNQTARSLNSFMDIYCQRNKTNLSYTNTWALLTTLQGGVINRYFEKRWQYRSPLQQRWPKPDMEPDWELTTNAKKGKFRNC